jgi:hypothetical protein
MNPRPSDSPEPVLLIIADISGYTRYMTANAKTLAHSQTIISELIHTIVRQIELPLEVAKLEGDAIFLFCRKQDPARSWPDTSRIIGGKLFSFFTEFGRKLSELSHSTTCNCNACAHIEKLRLKIVVHSGEALFHRVLNFAELAGVDVIIVHRLLKNSVKAEQYLLLTEAARHDLELPDGIRLAESAETYNDIGRVNTLVYLPEGEETVVHVAVESSLARRFGSCWALFCKLWFAPFSARSVLFHNLPSNVGRIGRIAFALITILLTPLFLPVGAVFAFFHAIKPTAKMRHTDGGHEHKADGSCCRLSRKP